MIWFVISSKGTGQFYVVKDTIKTRSTIKSTADQIQERFLNGETLLFMQDGTFCHRAWFVKAYLQGKMCVC